MLNITFKSGSLLLNESTTFKTLTTRESKMATKQKTKAPNYHYDAIVIGTGPGGEGVAMQLAKAGKKVAVVERYEAVGGGCTHWGTIPSKALRHSVSRLIEYNTSPLFADNHLSKSLTFSDIMRHASGVVKSQTRLRSSFYDRNRVTLFHGEASFVDAHTLEITRKDGSKDTVTAGQIAIATGSQTELDGLDVLQPGCPIEFVITIEALKEGWDCSFAYVFCSVKTPSYR
jgi:pyruvate/2-oxoglutarate dehydrogenase complex dihydrolipoamide dehydrogenase (E3) component